MHWNIDQKGKDQEVGCDIDEQKKLRRMSRNEKINGNDGRVVLVYTSFQACQHQRCP